jgi:hypothetical protein
MRDIYEVLYYKEMELRRIRKEIEVLHTVAPLLQDANEDGGDAHHLVGASVIRFNALGKVGGGSSVPNRGPG